MSSLSDLLPPPDAIFVTTKVVTCEEWKYARLPIRSSVRRMMSGELNRKEAQGRRYWVVYLEEPHLIRFWSFAAYTNLPVYNTRALTMARDWRRKRRTGG